MDWMDLYYRGLTEREIGEQLHYAPETIAKRRQAHGLLGNSRDKPMHERLLLYRQGLTDREIAEATGTRRDAVQMWRWRKGLTANQEGDAYYENDAVNL